MDPLKIAYTSNAQMKQHFKNVYLRIGSIQDEMRFLRLFLPRCMRIIVQLEILFQDIKMPDNYEPIKQLPRHIAKRRKRSMADIVLYLNEQVVKRENVQIGFEADYESEAFTDLEDDLEDADLSIFVTKEFDLVEEKEEIEVLMETRKKKPSRSAGKDDQKVVTKKQRKFIEQDKENMFKPVWMFIAVDEYNINYSFIFIFYIQKYYVTQV